MNKLSEGRLPTAIVMFSMVDSNGQAVFLNQFCNRKLTVQDIHDYDTSMVDEVLTTVLNSGDSIYFLKGAQLSVRFIYLTSTTSVYASTKRERK